MTGYVKLLFVCLLSLSLIAGEQAKPTEVQSETVKFSGAADVVLQFGTFKIEIPGSLMVTAVTSILAGVFAHRSYHKHVTKKL